MQVQLLEEDGGDPIDDNFAAYFSASGTDLESSMMIRRTNFAKSLIDLQD